MKNIYLTKNQALVVFNHEKNKMVTIGPNGNILIHYAQDVLSLGCPSDELVSKKVSFKTKVNTAINQEDLISDDEIDAWSESVPDKAYSLASIYALHSKNGKVEKVSVNTLIDLVGNYDDYYKQRAILRMHGFISVVEVYPDRENSPLIYYLLNKNLYTKRDLDENINSGDLDSDDMVAVNEIRAESLKKNKSKKVMTSNQLCKYLQVGRGSLLAWRKLPDPIPCIKMPSVKGDSVKVPRIKYNLNDVIEWLTRVGKKEFLN